MKKINKLLLNFGKIHVGSNSKIVGPFYCGTEVKIKIGENCWIGKNLHIEGNGTVVIKNDCDLAPDIMFVTGSHKIGSRYRRAGEGTEYKIIVNNGCWIGARTTIFGDISIGEGSVVGAAALVNKNVEENVIVAGVPIKTIKRLDGRDEK